MILLNRNNGKDVGVFCGKKFWERRIFSFCLICESYYFSGFELCIEFILLIVIEERNICICICSYFLLIVLFILGKLINY